MPDEPSNAFEPSGAATVPYSYKTLGHDEFRVLVVDRGDLEAPISASFRISTYQLRETRSIKNTPPIIMQESSGWARTISSMSPAATHFTWDAISYAWEGQTPSEVIHVDSKPLKVTKNVVGIIKDLRQQFKETILWIDAICINQIDDEEKSHQVSMMGEIYQLARTVIIWLGPNMEWDKDWVFDAASWLKDKRPRGSLSPGERPRFETLLDYFKKDNPNTHFTSPFDSAMRCSWFQRIWVVQEAVLANSLIVQFGPRSIPWELFSSATLRFMSNAEADIALTIPMDDCYAHCLEQKYGQGTQNGLSMIYLIDCLRKWVQRSGFPIAPSELVHMCKNRQASVPSDMIYAISGFFGLKKSRWPMADLPIDYKLSASDVYKDFIFWCIRQEHTLDILAQQRHNDWSRGNAYLDFNTTETNPLTPSLAQKRENESTHAPICRQEGDIIILRGFMIDTIKGRGPKGISFSFPDSNSEPLREWQRAIPDDEEAKLVIFREARPSLRTLREIITWTLGKQPLVTHLWRDKAIFGSPRSTKFSEILLTEQGRLAIAFPYMNYECGPKVCALFGGCALFILQPVQDNTAGKPLYNLICGDCFIDGFENGKGVEIARKLRLQEEDFYVV